MTYSRGFLAVKPAQTKRVRTALLAFGVAVAVLCGSAACGGKSPQNLPYSQQIAADRGAKDAQFAEASDSPIKADKRQQFLPLAYYAPDEMYRVPAMLAPFEGEEAIEMPTSTGKRREMRRAGQLKFSVKGQTLTLTAFVEATDRQMARLFVPFADQTNGSETYPAGRYLDLTRTATGLYDLDFNRAYHPYCYFNDEYDCPFPPAENRLGIPIRAGERMKGARASAGNSGS